MENPSEKFQISSKDGLMPKKSFLDENVFSEITPETAYWLGILLTDGCIHKNTNRIQLCLIDKEHIEKFKNFLNSNQSIEIRFQKKETHSTQYQLRVSSKKIVQDLASFGIISQKSLIAKVDQRLKYNHHFWRGAIDGDGSIFFDPKGFPCVRMTGTKEVCQSFADFVNSLFSTSNFKPNGPDGNVYRVNVCGDRARTLLKSIYKDATFFLERKRKIAENIINLHWHRRFIELAKLVSTWSKDPSTKVGAVLVRPNRTICTLAFNGFPQNVDDNYRVYKNRDEKLKRIIHAEMNSLLFSRGEELNGYIMYTFPFQPCSKCAAAIIQRGVSKIVTLKPSDDVLSRWNEDFLSAREMFDQSGVSLEFIEEKNKEG